MLRFIGAKANCAQVFHPQLCSVEVPPPGPQTCTCAPQAWEGQGPLVPNSLCLISPSAHPHQCCTGATLGPRLGPCVYYRERERAHKPMNGHVLPPSTFIKLCLYYTGREQAFFHTHQSLS